VRCVSLMPYKIKFLVKWFLIAGGVGVLVAIAFYAIAMVPELGESRIFQHAGLWLVPAAILGLAEPQSSRDVVDLLTIVLVANFLLYGIIGAVCSGIYLMFRGPNASARESKAGL
jgi:hypothetical protein